MGLKCNICIADPWRHLADKPNTPVKRRGDPTGLITEQRWDKATQWQILHSKYGQNKKQNKKTLKMSVRIGIRCKITILQ
jgi:hypothetical protein